MIKRTPVPKEQTKFNTLAPYSKCTKGHQLEYEGHGNWFCPICDKEGED